MSNLYLDSSSINKNQLILEIKKRLDNGSKIFRNSLGDGSDVFGNNYNRGVKALNLISTYDKDLFDRLVNRDSINMYIDSNPNLSKLNYGEYGFFQKVQLADMIEQAKIGSEGISIINQLLNKNSNSLAYFDLGLLDENVINKFSDKFIMEIGMDRSMSLKLLSLKDNYPKVFEQYSKIVKNNEFDNSLGTYYIKNKDCLNFMFDGAEQLNRLDFSNIDTEDLTNYMIGYSQQKKYTTNFTNNYVQNINELADKSFAENYKKYYEIIDDDVYSYKEEILKTMKDNYFQKYFSSSYKEIEEIMVKYGNNLSGISKYLNDTDGNILKTFNNNINKIMNITDVEELYDLYDNQSFRLSKEDIISMNELARKKYVDSYIDELNKTKNKIETSNFETINYNGKNIKVVDLNDDFGLLVHSSDTGYVVDKKLIDNSYIKSWNNMNDPRTHGLSMSYITNENIGTSPVGGIGVLYGFYDLKNENIFEMAPYDVNSNINNYGYTSGNKQIFISADSMSKNTTRVYNEIVADRKSAKPSCVILYTDASEQLKNNAYKAASEWNIPILRVDKETLAKNQMNSVANSINSFKSTANINDLKNAIETYETSMSSFKQNAYVKEGFHDVTSSIDNSSVEHLFDSSKINNSINDYIESLSKMPNNSNKVDEFLNVLNDTKKRYDVSNENGTKKVANTKSVLDIDGYISKLNSIRR